MYYYMLLHYDMMIIVRYDVSMKECCNNSYFFAVVFYCCFVLTNTSIIFVEDVNNFIKNGWLFAFLTVVNECNFIKLLKTIYIVCCTKHNILNVVFVSVSFYITTLLLQFLCFIFYDRLFLPRFLSLLNGNVTKNKFFLLNNMMWITPLYHLQLSIICNYQFSIIQFHETSCHSPLNIAENSYLISFASISLNQNPGVFQFFTSTW